MSSSTRPKMDDKYTIVFESGQIIGKYLRNNRGRGRKNLRCFPKCTTLRHIKRGFCGNSISITVFGKNISEHDLVILQLLPSNTPICTRDNHEKNRQHYVSIPDPDVDEQMEVDIIQGERYLKHDLTKFQQYRFSEAKYLCPQKLYIGKPDLEPKEKGISFDVGESITRFDIVPKSWSYAWNSNKHCHNIDHVVRAYFMKRVGHISGQDIGKIDLGDDSKNSTNSSKKSADNNNNNNNNGRSSGNSNNSKTGNNRKRRKVGVDTYAAADGMYIYECKAIHDSSNFTITSSKSVQKIKKMSDMSNNILYDAGSFGASSSVTMTTTAIDHGNSFSSDGSRNSNDNNNNGSSSSNTKQRRNLSKKRKSGISPSSDSSGSSSNGNSAKKKRIDVGTYKSALSSSSNNSNEEESESPKSDPTRHMFMGYDGAVLSADEDNDTKELW